jgi:hypothetical protein
MTDVNPENGFRIDERKANCFQLQFARIRLNYALQGGF